MKKSKIVSNGQENVDNNDDVRVNVIEDKGTNSPIKSDNV